MRNPLVVELNRRRAGNESRQRVPAAGAARPLYHLEQRIHDARGVDDHDVELQVLDAEHVVDAVAPGGVSYTSRNRFMGGKVK